MYASAMRDEHLECCAGGGLVDEALQQERFGQRNELAREQQDREADGARTLLTQVRREQAPVRMFWVQLLFGGAFAARPPARSPDSEAAGDPTKGGQWRCRGISGRADAASRYRRRP